MAEEKTNKQVRAFIAIELPETLKDKLTDIQTALKANLKDGVSWAKSETVHLTVKFIGNIEPSRLKEVSTAIKNATAVTGSFELTAKGLGAFPSIARPSTLWVGIEESRELKALHERVESRTEDIGLQREKKGLHPHLTLARVRSSRAKAEIRRRLVEALKDFTLELSHRFTVKEVVLFKSELHKDGAVHTPIERFNLEG